MWAPLFAGTMPRRTHAIVRDRRLAWSASCRAPLPGARPQAATTSQVDGPSHHCGLMCCANWKPTSGRNCPRIACTSSNGHRRSRLPGGPIPVHEFVAHTRFRRRELDASGGLLDAYYFMFVSRSRKRKPSRGLTSRIRIRVMVAQPHSRGWMSFGITPARAICQSSLNSCRRRTAHSRTRASTPR